MKRIAIVTSGTFPVPPVKGGAVENLVQNIVNENEKHKKMEISVFSIGDEKAERISRNYNNSKFYFINVPKTIGYGNKLIYKIATRLLHKNKTMSYRFIAQRLYYIYKVALILHKNNYDRVILENHSTLFLCLKLFGNYRKYKNKYIYHMHNEIKSFYGCEKIISNTPIVMGVSDYILSTFKKKVPNISSSNTFVVLRNRIDKDIFDKKYTNKQIIEEKKKLNIPLNKKVILFSGRMNAEKGIDKLLKAWKKVDLDNAILLVVGSYYYKSGIKNDKFGKQVNKLVNNAKNLIFTGYIDYSKIPKIYAMSDLVVLPSMWEDPAPLTVIESLTSGCPLITTNSGGIPEYVKGSKTVILDKTDPNFINKLSLEIKEIIESNNKQRVMSKSAKNLTKNWSSKAYFEAFYNIVK